MIINNIQLQENKFNAVQWNGSNHSEIAGILENVYKYSKHSIKRKVFISKYALKQGIIEREISWERIDFYAPDLIYHEIRWMTGPYGMTLSALNYAASKEWHETLEEAKEYAEKMRLKKISDLKSQLTKFENLRF